MTAARHLRAVGTDAPRYGIAVRVSAVMGRGGDTFHSPETQERACRSFVDRLGGVVPEGAVFVDLDVSGSVAPDDRPGLGEALRQVRAGLLRGVVVYDLSRWSRDTVTGLRALEEVTALGGEVHSTAEAVDLTTPGGIFATTVQLAAAKLRRDEVARSWRATHEAHHRRGRPHGRLTLGYVRDDEGRAVFDPVMGPAVRQAFADYAAGIVSKVELARRLGELRGQRVYPCTVDDVLRCTFYVGKVRLRGVELDGEHEHLVDADTFDRVQRRLEAEKGRTTKRGPAHALARLAVCDACGQGLRRSSPQQGKPTARLGCRRQVEVHDCPGCGSVAQEKLEQLVLAEVVEAARKMRDSAPELARRQARAARAVVDLASLRRELSETERALGEAGVLLARGVLTEPAYRATSTQLEEAAAALRAQLTAAEDAAEALPGVELASAAERLQELWPTMTPAERGAALRPFVAQVRVKRAAYDGQPLAERVVIVER